ncbi:MAG: SgcJ/EcaC family oxidoreductase [Rhodothermales bacterium]|nr:SgcJ/EcaC family oxidoreductase [Rhodothermales bacterium]
MSRFLLLAALLAGGLAACRTAAPTAGPAEARAAVRAVLDRQVAAWNAGDVEGFMDGYARSDSLRFASGGSVQTGWQTTLDRYRRSYPDRAAMGTLSFDLREIRVLSPRYALVFGAWRLDRVADQPSGLFTLLFEKRAEGWRVVHDHTSSAD